MLLDLALAECPLRDTVPRRNHWNSAMLLLVPQGKRNYVDSFLQNRIYRRNCGRSRDTWSPSSTLAGLFYDLEGTSNGNAQERTRHAEAYDHIQLFYAKMSRQSVLRIDLVLVIETLREVIHVGRRAGLAIP